MDLFIKKQITDEEAFLMLEGSVDTLTSPSLETAIREASEKANTLHIDFTKVNYISSAGLRALLIGEKLMSKKGGSMKIINPCPDVMEVFDITGFSSILDIVS